MKLVKRCLREILRNDSRPLTYSYDELSEPLTPLMLVTDKWLLNKNSGVLYDVTIADENTDTVNI